jgi:KDO2-lipid IV(A) lauroyltransferase
MFRQWLVYVCMRLVICVVQALPIEACQTLARGLAHLAHDLLRVRRNVIDDNLRHAFPQQSDAERRRMALGMWEHVFLMVCELSQVPRKIHDTNWRDHVTIAPDERRLLVGHLLSERPLVVVSGHYGNFEVGGVMAGIMGFPTHSVARPLDNPYLHRFITKFREATGQYMLDKRGSANQIDAILQSGGTLMLLGDQSAGPKGCWVEFFGRPASCHKAVAIFSLVNRAPMLLAYSRRIRPMQFQVGVAAEFDPERDEMGGVRPLTQWYNDHLERVIRQVPAQYWWLHKRWKNKPHWQKKPARRTDPASDAAQRQPHVPQSSAHRTERSQP